jgi:hypothetical protein
LLLLFAEYKSMQAIQGNQTLDIISTPQCSDQLKWKFLDKGGMVNPFCSVPEVRFPWFTLDGSMTLAVSICKPRGKGGKKVCQQSRQPYAWFSIHSSMFRSIEMEIFG